MDDRRRPDILIRNPRGFDRQVILDVAVTSVDLFGRVAYDDPSKPLEDRYKQKIDKYHGLTHSCCFFSYRSNTRRN